MLLVARSQWVFCISQLGKPLAFFFTAQFCISIVRRNSSNFCLSNQTEIHYANMRFQAKCLTNLMNAFISIHNIAVFLVFQSVKWIQNSYSKIHEHSKSMLLVLDLRIFDELEHWSNVWAHKVFWHCFFLLRLIVCLNMSNIFVLIWVARMKT